MRTANALASALVLGLVCFPVPGRAETDFVTIEFHMAQPPADSGIEDICCDDTAGIWSGNRARGKAGIGGAPVWIRLPPLRPGSVLDFDRMVDEAMLFERLPGADGAGWRVSVSGDSVVRSGQALPVPGTAFFISDDAAADRERYLRVAQPSVLSFGLRLWEPETYHRQQQNSLTISVLLIGSIVAIALFNIVVSLIARDIAFGLNGLTILSLVAVDLYLSGLGLFWLWPAAASNVIANAAFAGAILFGALFIRTFLFETSGTARSGRLLEGMAAMAGAVCLAGFFLPYWIAQTVLIFELLLLPIAMVPIVVSLAWQGNRSARLLLFPLAGVMLPGGVFSGLHTIFGLIPGVYEAHLLEVTLAFEALAFSLALAGRIRSHRAMALESRARLSQARLEAAERYSTLQEQERRRLASDLHDAIGHDLVMIAAILDNQVKSGPDTDDLDALSALTRQTLRRVRDISHDLHPETLRHLGWREAVTALFRQLETSCGIETALHLGEGEPMLSHQAQLHVYRILQEVVSNIAKHAQAKTCEARFRDAGGRLEISVEDDGIGGAEDGQGGLGFASVAERANLLGGNWGIGSAASGGTRFHISVPLGEGHAA